MTKISVIIPTFNEDEYICRLLDHLITTKLPESEIIVADGGSSDETINCCQKYNQIRVLRCKEKGRSSQMREAVSVANGKIFYFVHADSLPPISWEKDISESISKDYKLGGYRFKFESDRPLLKFNSWMTRINILSFRGGDQSFFVSDTCYHTIGGFSEIPIMEEYDFFRKAKKNGFDYLLIQKDTAVSARKYEKNTYLRVNFENFLAMLKFRLGVDYGKIKSRYSKKIK